MALTEWSIFVGANRDKALQMDPVFLVAKGNADNNFYVLECDPITGELLTSVGAAGTVVGPGSSTDNAIVRWDGATGALVKDSNVTIDASGNISLPAFATVDGRDVSVDGTAMDGHIASTSNPHSVTKSQVGLSNVTNDTQLKIASNLSDLASAATARANLGLGSFATISSLAHSALTGLSSDDHAQYALLAGRSGGQILIGDTASGGNLTLQSTAHATLGTVVVNSLPSTVSTINHLAFGVTNAVTANSLNYAGTVIQLESAHTATSSGTHRGLHVQAGIASGNAFNASGLRSYSAQIAHLGTGTLSSAVGMEILSPINSGGGTITTSYGLYVAPQIAGGTGYGVYVAGTTDQNYFGGATTFNAGITAPFVTGGTTSGADLFLASTSHATKGEIRFGTVSSYDEATASLGIGTRTPAANIHSLATTEQLRLGYSAGSYMSTTVDVNGNTTLALTGTSPAFIFSNAIGIGRDPTTYIFDVYNASATSFLNIETGAAGANGSIRLGNPGRKWVMGVRGDISDGFAFADQTASAIRFFIDSSGNTGFGTTTVSARVHAISTSEQLRVGYDASSYFKAVVASSGATVFSTNGTNVGFTFTPTGTANFKLGTGTLSLISTGSSPVTGNATLVGGTKAVLSDAVTANTIVLLTRKTSGGVIGTDINYTLQTSAPKGFTINSDSGLDTSTFSWILIESF